MDRYQYQSRLGEGISSVVYKALDKRRNEHVALKTIDLENEDEGVPSTALREISILHKLKHPNIIELRDVVHHEKQLVIALEFVQWNLREFADQFELSSDNICNICKQLYGAIAYCHEQNVIHRDIKPHNILIDKNQVIKLADFGLSRELGIYVRSCTSEVVTLWYRPPDVLGGNQHYGASVDVWSLGCILSELSSPDCTPTFPGQDSGETLRKIFQLLGSPDPDLWSDPARFPNYANLSQNFGVYNPQSLEDYFPKLDEDGIDLLRQCWRYDTEARISSRDACMHRYFAK